MAVCLAMFPNKFSVSSTLKSPQTSLSSDKTPKTYNKKFHIFGKTEITYYCFDRFFENRIVIGCRKDLEQADFYLTMPRVA